MTCINLIGGRVLTVVPLSALFVLFDFIVFNPFHHETEFNLALMDVAVTYFSRLETVTQASFRCSKLAGFAHICNDFILGFIYGRTPDRQDLVADSVAPCGWSRNFSKFTEYIIPG